MKIVETALEGVIEVEPVRHGDERGWFSETWNAQRWRDAGYDIDWVQDNESLSGPKGTIRGIHFQRDPSAQDKLVRVVAGRILDVAVDLRRGSPTMGRYVAVELSAERGNQLLVPKGFGHGFVTLEADCHVAYKTSAHYDPERDAGVSFGDPAIGIDWGIEPEHAIVSQKDADAPLLADADHLLFD